MSDGGFNKAELLTDEALLSEAGRRMSLKTDLLERLAGAVDNRTYDVFLFLWKYGPATWDQLAEVFPKGTLDRVLRRLEANEAVTKTDFKYHIRR